MLCLGYRSDAIKRYFLEYDETQSNDFVLTDGGRVELLKSDLDDWEITFADTGVNATLADRPRAVRHYIGDDEMYADVLTDAPLDRLVDDFPCA